MRLFCLLGCMVAAACTADGPTSLLLEVSGPDSTTSLELRVELATGRILNQTIPLGVDGAKLPARIVVVLPDIVTVAKIDLEGGGVRAHAEVTSKVHRQVVVPLHLSSESMDLTGLIPADLADVAPADLTGVPPVDLAGLPADLATTTGGPPVARLIANAYYTDYNGGVFESPVGMSHDGFEIPSTGVMAGDLLLLIASVDNGSNSVWPNPIAPGFTQLRQEFYGIDGQTYVVAWKIASSGEPASYTGLYGNGKGSSSAVLTLIAVSGAHPTTPINTFSFTAEALGLNPVVATNSGVTTTVDNCLLVYAAGSDWSDHGKSNTFTVPSGFTSLSQLGDRGNESWDWTSQMVAAKPMGAKGPSGTISGTMTSTVQGVPWTFVIAVAPTP